MIRAAIKQFVREAVLETMTEKNDSPVEMNFYTQKEHVNYFRSVCHQPLIPKRTPRSTLQILFKIISLVFLPKGNIGHKINRQPALCVMNLAQGMSSHTVLKIIGATGVISTIGAF
jgi:hypothetical protein